jgi:hypothetical protein
MPDRQKPAMIRVKVVDDQGNLKEMKTVNVDDVRPSAEQRSTLTPEQVARAHALWDRIGRAVRKDLDRSGWVGVFTREQDAERELLVWEAIASTVDDLWNDAAFSKKLLKQSSSGSR